MEAGLVMLWRVRAERDVSSACATAQTDMSGKRDNMMDIHQSYACHTQQDAVDWRLASFFAHHNTAIPTRPSTINTASAVRIFFSSAVTGRGMRIDLSYNPRARVRSKNWASTGSFAISDQGRLLDTRTKS